MPDTRRTPDARDDPHPHLRDLIDVLSHELRQPIAQACAAVGAALAAMSSGQPPDGGLRQAEATLSLSQQTLQAAQAHVDNTLAIAGLLIADAPIHREDGDVDLMIALAVGDMPVPHAGRIRIERLTATRTVAMEPNLMRLALRNLLSNALKFSPPGSLIAMRVADSDEPLALLIDVIDQGPGIGEHLLPYLFDKRIRQAEGADGPAWPGAQRPGPAHRAADHGAPWRQCRTALHRRAGQHLPLEPDARLAHLSRAPIGTGPHGMVLGCAKPRLAGGAQLRRDERRQRVVIDVCGQF